MPAIPVEAMRGSEPPEGTASAVPKRTGHVRVLAPEVRIVDQIPFAVQIQRQACAAQQCCAGD